MANSLFDDPLKSTPQMDGDKILNSQIKGIPVRQVQTNDGRSTSGTEIYAGYFAEEYLETLHGSQAAKVYDEMRRKDAQAKMLVSCIKLPLLAGVFEWRPYDDTPEANIHAQFLSFAFDSMSTNLSQTKNNIFSFPIFGHSVVERVHKVIEKPFQVEGKTILNTSIGLDELRWINPKTIEKWNFVNKRFAGITQMAFGDLEKTEDIPKDFLSIFSVDREGDNLEGISLLRACYGAYFRKANYLKLNAIGLEKFAIGIPVGTIPEGEENTVNRVIFEDALTKFCTHHANYLIKTQGYEVDVKFNNYDPQKVEVAIDNEDRRMSKSFLASFLELGVTTGGSQALSTDLSSFFRNSLEYLVGIVEAEFNRVIIPELINLNFPNVQNFPKLFITGVTDDAGLIFSQVMTNLVNSKMIIPDMALEEYLRKLYGLPDKDETPNIKQSPMAPNIENAIKAFRERLK